MNLSEYLSFIIDLIVLPEMSPPWWFKIGLGLTDTLLALCLIVTIKMMFEIFLYRILIYVTELLYKILGKWKVLKLRIRLRMIKNTLLKVLKINQQSKSRSEVLANGRRSRKSKITATLQQWGYVGLFIAGFLPLPAFWGSIGPFIYNLERINKPWFKIWNYHLLCLWLGYMIKTIIIVLVFHFNLK